MEILHCHIYADFLKNVYAKKSLKEKHEGSLKLSGQEAVL